MIKKIAERYFLFKCIKGSYQTIDMNEIWDDIYCYISKSKLYTNHEEDLAHISVLYDNNSISYLNIGFLLSDYIRPGNGITVKKIQAGYFDVTKQSGIYKDNDINKASLHYRKHLNSTEETLPNFLCSEIYTLLS